MSSRFGPRIGPIKHADWNDDISEDTTFTLDSSSEETDTEIDYGPTGETVGSYVGSSSSVGPEIYRKPKKKPLKGEDTTFIPYEGFEKEARRHRDPLAGIIAALLGLTIGALAFLFCATEYLKLNRDVTIETGDPITLDLFFNQMIEDSSFVTDISTIDTNVPSSYMLTINVYKIDVNVVLRIKDTIAPRGDAIPQEIFANELPDVNSVVENLYDHSGTVMVEYFGTPDVSEGGKKQIPVVLTDLYGNTSVVNVPFTIIKDVTPPVISNIKDRTLYVGETLMLLEGVSVEDDYDPAPNITVDMSEVDLNKEGEYQATYVATDDVGNQSTASVKITVRNRPDNFYDEELIYSMARKYYDQIIPDENMSDVEKAMRIFKWVYEKMKYVSTSKKTHWTGGAYDGFSTLRGDCYNDYACAKALLDLAGIENKYIYGTGKTDSSKFHCWNLVKLNGQWYHCDGCKSRVRKTYLFMATDKENDQRWEIASQGLPDRAKKSVQKKIDYKKLKWKGD